MNDATVVCRQLGYQDGAEEALKNRVYGPFFGPVWLTNLHCTGNEKNVMECAHDVIGNKSEEMSTAGFASVICKGGKMLGGRFYQCININNLPTSLPRNLPRGGPGFLFDLFPASSPPFKGVWGHAKLGAFLERCYSQRLDTR